MRSVLMCRAYVSYGLVPPSVNNAVGEHGGRKTCWTRWETHDEDKALEIERDVAFCSLTQVLFTTDTI